MLELPRSTEFNKRIPKQKFYENLQITPALKKSFVDQIKVIYWKNKIAATTVNLAAGEYVTELEVFIIRLNGGMLDEGVLKQIDREVPYHILTCWNTKEKRKRGLAIRNPAAPGMRPSRSIDTTTPSGCPRRSYRYAWKDCPLMQFMRTLFGRLPGIRLKAGRLKL